MLRDCLHEKRGNAVANLPVSPLELSREAELVRKGTEPHELQQRRPPAFARYRKFAEEKRMPASQLHMGGADAPRLVYGRSPMPALRKAHENPFGDQSARGDPKDSELPRPAFKTAADCPSPARRNVATQNIRQLISPTYPVRTQAPP